MAGHDRFQNKACEYFPCHEHGDPETFSCQFCFCPLYALGDRCGGSFRYTEQGIKDCSACLRPHRPENYNDICEKLKEGLRVTNPELHRELAEFNESV